MFTIHFLNQTELAILHFSISRQSIGIEDTLLIMDSIEYGLVTPEYSESAVEFMRDHFVSNLLSM